MNRNFLMQEVNGETQQKSPFNPEDVFRSALENMETDG